MQSVKHNQACFQQLYDIIQSFQRKYMFQTRAFSMKFSRNFNEIFAYSKNT